MTRFVWVMVVMAFGCKHEAAAPPAGQGAAGSDGAVVATAPAVAVDAAAAAAPISVDAAVSVDAATGAGTGTGTGGEAMPETWWTTGCPKVIAKLGACAGDAGFRAKLTADEHGAAKKATLAHLDAAKRFQKSTGICNELTSVTFEDQGFLDGRWDDLAAPEVLASCDALADAIVKDGGMFGGDVDE